MSLAASLGIGIEPEVALILSMNALLPDIDVFFGFHWMYTHSAPLMDMVGAPAAAVLGFFGLGWPGLTALSLALSHPLIDNLKDRSSGGVVRGLRKIDPSQHSDLARTPLNDTFKVPKKQGETQSI